MAAATQAGFPKFPKFPLGICVYRFRFLPIIASYLFSLKGCSHKASMNFVVGQKEEKGL